MLRKSNRLPAGQKLENAKSYSTEHLRVLAKPNNTEYNRFGFVVGKKVDKRAVVRNRLKRLLREAVRNFLVSPKGQEVLFIVKKSFVEMPTEKVFEMVKEILEKLT